MWKKKDYTGLNDLIWYSEAEYKELEDKLAKFEDMLYNIYKAQDTCTPIDYIEDYIDEELLEKAGGIVQGMSGSPIIQNDMIILRIVH